jgi:hypothetical protein
MRAGVDEDRATILAGGAGLQGAPAAAYVGKHKDDGIIFPSEGDRLFQISYPEKEQYAKDVYGRATQGVPSAVKWEDLDPKIRDIAIDFAYQGTNYDQMKAASKNNTGSLIQYIKDTPALDYYEMRHRGRINYLRSDP